MQVCIEPNTEQHPGFHPRQWDRLLIAHDLGFKVLRMINKGIVRTQEIPDDMYDDIEDFWRYEELLVNCREFYNGTGLRTKQRTINLKHNLIWF